uniref:Retrovirus-related Pol polyprotein from transposon TNT 1-94 n=1 Tax=Tanacetum cinerariifolium TaxID=118510 RepID=A0A6L2P605_TANCI|nr:retrovirus-related Pol polyprotein from transposon TNT 1-94 [Tanacetum cinerariifolium]
MANLSEDIQCSGSDTRPPMLDRIHFASWQQRIRLYCRGKENGVNILKSIDEGLFQMGTLRETLTEGTEGALHLGPERPRVYSDLTPKEKERYNADIRATNILLQELPKDIYSLINHYTNAKDIWDNVKMLLEGSELTKEDRESQLMQLNSKFVNNMLPEWGRFVTAVKLDGGLRDSNYDQLVNKIEDKGTIYGVQVQLVMGELEIKENGVALDEEQLLFITGGQDNDVDEDVNEQPVQDLALNVDKVFQDDDCDAFDSDVDEAPTAQTMFMTNLSSADPVYDEASPSYDLDILSEVHDHDHYQDAICEHHEVHEIHDGVQPNYVVDLHTDYTSDSYMISYDQYVKDNAVQVVQRDRSRHRNFVKKFIGTVRFGNDYFGAIMGYGDYVIGDNVISRLYYVEVLGHNLFFVGQFCDSDMEVAFKKHSCYVRDTGGVELIKGSRGSNLYTISVEDMMKSSPICLLSKASKTKSWLWHHRLNHLHFGTINDLERKDLVRGLPRLKFEKDHLCSACQLGKSRKHTHLPKLKTPTWKFLIPFI